MNLLDQTIKEIRPLDVAAMHAAQERLDSLLKPPGSLGKLEDIARQLAGITGKVINTINKKRIMVMCGDNGVTVEGVTSFPSSVSALVADTMARGISGVSVLARHAGADLTIVDLGLDADIANAGILNKKIRKSTSNIAVGPAMTREEAVRAIETGIETTFAAIDEGVDLLGTGEIGIGNTTSSSAVLYAFTGALLDEIVGRGAGLNDEGLARKKDIVHRAVAVNVPDLNDPLDVIAKVGGFDIAGLAGCYIAAANRRIPIVIDGFISGVAAVAAIRMAPGARNFMFASHLSAEPGAVAVGRELALAPMLTMDMRLGEGTGCALAFMIIEASVEMMTSMGTFSDIGM
jgi:nicotinate-nucleotide--dimethylbenzimidazole phosphoribosyltransferase